MITPLSRLFILLLLLSMVVSARAAAPNEKKPNVLFLAVDDMKDWVNCLGGYEGTVHTPNMDRLAAGGMLFRNAYCVSPVCAPSRAAILTGQRPSTTGLYGNGHWLLPNYPDVVTLPAHFRKNGYHVVGAGKIFHHTAGNHPPNQWDDFLPLRFRNDPWFRGAKLNYPWSPSGPTPAGFPFSQVPGLPHENDWGSLKIPAADYDDALTAAYAVKFLAQPQAKPFFLAAGFFRPHLPWYVPRKYFDQYPLDSIVLPKTRDHDLDDVPPAGQKLAAARRADFKKIRQAGRWKQAIQAYLASISYADAQLGRVLAALENSPHARNTVIVLWSDHGWHLGEKQHWHKSTLWEEATHVPLIISAPGFPSGDCTRPVSLLDLYPTLNNLCHLKTVAGLEGNNLVPLLRDPQTPWNPPALTEFQRGNAAVRSERYRYIRYRDGSEELYDHQVDPHEWKNIAMDGKHANIMQDLRKWLPTQWAPSAPTKSTFDFNPTTFTWTHKKTGKTISGR
ncbi:MAG: sulfatase [Planctomycetota bacterium]|nr:sulfatase [Planctomycetota bacterium]